ncbi:MAG: biopolymer transporter ExbD [Myxococcota bacterium]
MAAKLGDTGGNGNPYPANSEMNVTPFVDVMLVLLIIFMIAAPLSTVTVPVELPPATTKPEEHKAPDPVFVSIEKDGDIYVMEERIALAELPAKLREKTHDNTSERIFLRADQSLAYRVVMQVMNVMQDAGFLKVGLVAEEIEPAAS